MPSAPKTKVDLMFRAFSDPIRLRILSLIQPGELCVCDIVDILKLPQPTVSRHLAYLRRCGLVEVTRAWKFAHYRLAPPHHPVQANLIACVQSCFAGIKLLDAERKAARRSVAERKEDPCE